VAAIISKYPASTWVGVFSCDEPDCVAVTLYLPNRDTFAFLVGGWLTVGESGVPAVVVSLLQICRHPVQAATNIM